MFSVLYLEESLSESLLYSSILQAKEYLMDSFQFDNIYNRHGPNIK